MSPTTTGRSTRNSFSSSSKVCIVLHNFRPFWLDSLRFACGWKAQAEAEGQRIWFEAENWSEEEVVIWLEEEDWSEEEGEFSGFRGNKSKYQVILEQITYSLSIYIFIISFKTFLQKQLQLRDRSRSPVMRDHCDKSTRYSPGPSRSQVFRADNGGHLFQQCTVTININK